MIDESGVVIILLDAIVLSILNRSLVQTLVRLGAYRSLDLTSAEALNQRPPDFPGVVICTYKA